MAGLVMKNALSSPHDEVRRATKHDRWAKLDPVAKATVRSDLAAALSSPIDGARQAAAQAIAKTGGIDVPGGTWPELIPSLLSATEAGAASEAVQSTAVRAVGYLLEELDPEAIEPGVVNAILTSIVRCSGPSNGVPTQRSAVNALLQALSFCKENFTDARAGERNAIMGAMCTCTRSTDSMVRNTAYECISKVAELYYEALGPYMQTLAGLTFEAARGPDEDSAVNAIDFWIQVADEEGQRGESESAHYTKQALGPLVALCLELLCKQNEDDDEDSYSVAQAAGVCLTGVADTVGDMVLPHVLPFVQSSFNASDWHKREAAALAFGSMCESLTSECMRAPIVTALPALLGKLKPRTPEWDASPIVRDSVAWALGKIIEFHVAVMGLPTRFEGIITTLNGCLDDEARVAVMAAFALANLGQHMGDYEDPNTGLTPMSPHLLGLIQHLMVRAEQPDADEKNLRLKMYQAINYILEHSGQADHTVLRQVLVEAIRRLQAALDASAAPPGAVGVRDTVNLQVVLCAAVLVALRVLGESVRTETELLDSVMMLSLKIMAGRHSVGLEEAFRCVEVVAEILEGDFRRYMAAVAPTLRNGLLNLAEADVCMAAVCTMGQIAQSLKSEFEPYAAATVDALLTVARSQEVAREVKPLALSAFGDVAGALDEKIEPYLPPVLQILKLAGEIKITEAQREDEDLVEYIYELRESVVESWTAIHTAYAYSTKPDVPARGRELLGEHARPIAEFVHEWTKEVAAHREAGVPTSLVKAMVMMLG